MDNFDRNYVPITPKPKREVRFLGELPFGGRWIMHVIPISAKDVIVLVDQHGYHEPRVVKDGVMVVLKAVPVPTTGDPGMNVIVVPAELPSGDGGGGMRRVLTEPVPMPPWAAPLPIPKEST